MNLRENITDIAETQAKLKDLYKQGIICVFPYDNLVQLREKTFDENFTEYELENSGGYIKKSAIIDGIEFIALFKLSELSIDDILKLRQKESLCANTD